MKHIFIDSNIFFDHWYFESANFVLLMHYLEASGSQLLLSEIVCEEVENLHSQGCSDVIAEIQKIDKKIQKLVGSRLNHDFSKLSKEYSFKNNLAQKTSATIFFDYKQIDNRELVARAIKRIMPFKTNEKGFRDTLIWLSLLEYLKIEDTVGEIVFISKNSEDFFDEKKQNFHLDLLRDIERYKLRCTIHPFLDLESFIKTLDNDKEEVGFKDILQHSIHKIESQIENAAENLVNSLGISGFQKLLSLNGISLPFVNSILEYTFEIDEGIEDWDIVSYRKIDGKSFYLRYAFELRICTVQVGVPINEYLQNKQKIDNYYSNVYLAEEEWAYFERYFRRLKFQINFILDVENMQIDGAELIYEKV